MVGIENVIPIRKADRFLLCTGEIDESGAVTELDRVGSAYLKPSSSTFRLKLWMFPKVEYFLARDDASDMRYTLLCREEYELSGSGLKNRWHKVGIGEVTGNFIRIRFHLLTAEIFLCLFPERSKQEVLIDAA